MAFSAFTFVGSGADSNPHVSRQPVTGTQDGANKNFTTPSNYVSGTLNVYLNGINETFISETGANTFSIEEPPLASDVLRVSYDQA